MLAKNHSLIQQWIRERKAEHISLSVVSYAMIFPTPLKQQLHLSPFILLIQVLSCIVDPSYTLSCTLCINFLVVLSNLLFLEKKARKTGVIHPPFNQHPIVSKPTKGLHAKNSPRLEIKLFYAVYKLWERIPFEIPTEGILLCLQPNLNALLAISSSASRIFNSKKVLSM